MSTKPAPARVLQFRTPHSDALERAGMRLDMILEELALMRVELGMDHSGQKKTERASGPVAPVVSMRNRKPKPPKD